LLVWDKDSSTKIPSIASMHMCITTTLVHLYQTSSLLPGHVLIVASASFRLLYLLTYSVHISHIQVSFPFSVPPVYILPLVCDPCPILLHLF
jgi:hypothetical protein